MGMTTKRDMMEKYDAELDRLEKKLEDIKANLLALIPEDSELAAQRAKKNHGLAGLFSFMRHA
jgi:formiminotetrahydrofolate cyclodeaminase